VCVCVLDVRALLYVVAQSAGSVCGAAILKGVLPSVELSNTVPGPGVAIWSVFIIELIITFVLVLTVFATYDSLRPGISGSGPLATGLAVTMCHLWAVRCVRDLSCIYIIVQRHYLRLRVLQGDVSALCCRFYEQLLSCRNEQ